MIVAMRMKEDAKVGQRKKERDYKSCSIILLCSVWENSGFIVALMSGHEVWMRPCMGKNLLRKNRNTFCRRK